MNSLLSSYQLEDLAVRQLSDYQSKNPGTCFLDPNFNLDITSAYKLQDTVTKIRVQNGERVIGYKVGCTGPGTKSQFGMDGPIRGTLFASETRQNGVSLNPDEFCNLAIEGEMAIRIGENFKIEAIFPVIELHNFIFRAKNRNLSELIANNGINSGIVLDMILRWCAMENQNVLNFIDNLRGKKAYEERKSKKLGFTSLYDYIENKLSLKAQAEIDAKMAAEKEVLARKVEKTSAAKANSCSCCSD